MGAPEKNQFWKARSKHGKDKAFSTSAIFEETLFEYVQWNMDNPLMETIVVQKGIKVKNDKNIEELVYTMEVPKMRAMTIGGFCLFVGIGVRTFHDYAENKDGVYKDYSHIIHVAKEIFKTQKFEGAAAGFLNANIIARDLGLTDKKEVETSDVIKYKNVSKQFPDKE